MAEEEQQIVNDLDEAEVLVEEAEEEPESEKIESSDLDFLDVMASDEYTSRQARHCEFF